MQTSRQIERMWNARQYERLFRELVSFRPEAEFALHMDTGSTATPAAAMAILRLDELSQGHVSLYQKLVRCLIAAQEADGGWENPMLSALCLRALMAGRGGGEAVERGLTYLANLRKDEGIWPRIPFRRMPADALVSAFILYHLGNEPRFGEVISLDDATNWFDSHLASLDQQTRKLWERVALRYGLAGRRREGSLWGQATQMVKSRAFAG